jgi:ketosteroid isomerase-like protein
MERRGSSRRQVARDARLSASRGNARASITRLTHERERTIRSSLMSAFETIKAAYAAFGRNDPSVLFAAMDPAITWNEAEGNPLADRNPYVGPQAVGEGVFARLMAAIDNFTAVPGTFIDGGDHVVVLGRYGGTSKTGGATLDSPFCHVYRFQDGKVVTFQQYTDTAQWTRLMA